MKGEEVKNALINCAVGMSASEVVEEFAVEDGELKLVKKKVVKRDIPPDLKAVKMLLEDSPPPTDGELEEEKNRLLEMLKEGKFE